MGRVGEWKLSEQSIGKMRVFRVVFEVPFRVGLMLVKRLGPAEEVADEAPLCEAGCRWTGWGGTMGLWKVVKSVLAAFLGVQKEDRRREDFESGKPASFIIVGIIMTLVLIGLVAVVATMAAR
jgi:hypothetical protein